MMKITKGILRERRLCQLLVKRSQTVEVGYLLRSRSGLNAKYLYKLVKKIEDKIVNSLGRSKIFEYS